MQLKKLKYLGTMVSGILLAGVCNAANPEAPCMSTDLLLIFQSHTSFVASSSTPLFPLKFALNKDFVFLTIFNIQQLAEQSLTFLSVGMCTRITLGIENLESQQGNLHLSHVMNIHVTGCSCQCSELRLSYMFIHEEGFASLSSLC